MKFRTSWPLGFLSLLSVLAFPHVLTGDWMQASWLLWLVWLIHFIPIKKRG